MLQAYKTIYTVAQQKVEQEKEKERIKIRNFVNLNLQSKTVSKLN